MMRKWQATKRELQNSRDPMDRRSPRAMRFPLPPSPFRSALTLVELLITITIIATLAGMFLGASNAAMESARKARTKTTISKIHTLLMDRWDEYSTRRVEVNPTVEAAIKGHFSGNAKAAGEAMADLRLLALRELIRLEMPDRWNDVDLFQPPYTSISQPPNRVARGLFLRDIPPIAQAYNRRLLKAQNLTSGDTNKIRENGSAECLLMTVMLFTGDGEARTLFSRQDIGDTDEDGAPEFLDGWGRPIQWIRWPAGFAQRSDLMTGDTEIDHDTLDPFQRNSETAVPVENSFSGITLEDGSPLEDYIAHLRGTDGSNRVIGFRTVPLVYSTGPDGVGDLNAGVENILAFSNGILLDPYAWDPTLNDGSGGYYFGTPSDDPTNQDGDDNSLDNIHNHLLDGR